MTAPCRSPAWASSPPGGTPTHHPQPDVSHNTTPHVIIPPIFSTSNVFFLKILQTVTFLCNKKSVISSALYFSNIMYSYFILIACAQQLPAVKLGVLSIRSRLLLGANIKVSLSVHGCVEVLQLVVNVGRCVSHSTQHYFVTLFLVG